jgi:hypothetical protein
MIGNSLRQKFSYQKIQEVMDGTYSEPSGTISRETEVG